MSLGLNFWAQFRAEVTGRARAKLIDKKNVDSVLIFFAENEQNVDPKWSDKSGEKGPPPSASEISPQRLFRVGHKVKRNPKWGTQNEIVGVEAYPDRKVGPRSLVSLIFRPDSVTEKAPK